MGDSSIVTMLSSTTDSAIESVTSGQPDYTVLLQDISFQLHWLNNFLYASVVIACFLLVIYGFYRILKIFM